MADLTSTPIPGNTKDLAVDAVRHGRSQAALGWPGRRALLLLAHSLLTRSRRIVSESDAIVMKRTKTGLGTRQEQIQTMQMTASDVCLGRMWTTWMSAPDVLLDRKMR